MNCRRYPPGTDQLGDFDRETELFAGSLRAGRLGGFEDALRSGRKPSRGQIAAHDLYAFATEAWRLLRGALRRREQEMPG